MGLEAISDSSWYVLVVGGAVIGAIVTLICGWAIYQCCCNGKKKKKNGKKKATKRPNSITAETLKEWDERASHHQGRSSVIDNRLSAELLSEAASESSIGIEFNREILKKFVSSLAEGIECVWHRNGAAYKEIVLHLMGAEKLMWGSLGKKPKYSMLLQSVLSVRAGNTSNQFQPGVNSDLCLTVLSSDGSSLDLEMNSMKERDGFLVGLSMAVETLRLTNDR